MKIFQDNLTGLNNMTYLEENYQAYVESKKTYTISIDFKKLKYINDNFGHDAGDLTIIFFARFLKKEFNDSITIRRSGDEFLVVTENPVSLIIQKLKRIKMSITTSAKKKEIPIDFKFNCGIVENKLSFEKNIYRADITMYYAKKNNYFISMYNDKIMEEVLKNEDLINYVDKLIKTEGLVHLTQNIYTTTKENTNLKELYTRDADGKSLFKNEAKTILLKNYRIKQIDIKNLNNIFNYKFVDDEKVIINIHYQTLISHEYNFINILKEKLEKDSTIKDHICISIDVKGCLESMCELVGIIKGIELLGIDICVDALTNTTTSSLLPIISNTNPKYIKFKREFYFEGLLTDRMNVIIKGLVEVATILNITPIFTAVETEEEFNYVKNIAPNALISGRFLEKEKRLENFN